MRTPMRAAALSAAAILLLAGTACQSESTGDDSATGTADVEAAKKFIEPYVDAPSAFPITTPLAGTPKGKKVAYMDCGTPVCGLFFTLAEPAAAALGMELTRIDTGQAADTVNTAFDTAVNGGYDAVFVPAIPAPLWETGLDHLNEAGIPVVTTGVVGGDKSKIDVMQISDTNVTLQAELLAAYLVAERGADVNAVFYTTPELQFSGVMADAFKAKIDELCDGCEVRTADIPVATLGNRAPTIITDDLQAHPDTSTAVFAVGEQANGLTAAMSTAGLDTELIANAPGPETLEQIQNGDMDAALGVDIPVVAWTLIDSIGRLTTGQEPDPGAVADTPPLQILTADKLPDDVSRGWTGYPDFADRFLELWNVSG